MNGVIKPTRAWIEQRDDVSELMIEGTCAGRGIVACLATTAPHGDTTYTRDALLEMLGQLHGEIAKNTPHEKQPAFKCHNCGEVGYFHGSFSAAKFEMQHAQFHQKHNRCLPIFNGGCI